MTTVRETKRADELKTGDWLAADEVDGLPAEVLHAHAYPDGAEQLVALMFRTHGTATPTTIAFAAITPFYLASEADLDALREDAERVRLVERLHGLAVLIADRKLPVPMHAVRISLTARSAADVRAYSVALGGEIKPRSTQGTQVTVEQGGPTWTPGALEISCYSSDTTPEPEPAADPTGLAYFRADDEADDPTPVSGARVEAHVGGMTEAKPVTVYFSFGHGHTDPDTGEDLLDHYVTIVGPSYEACVNAMFRSRYGDRWGFDYLAGSAKAEEWIPQWTEHERIDLFAPASDS